jgi:hypothetical protein
MHNILVTQTWLRSQYYDCDLQRQRCIDVLHE